MDNSDDSSKPGPDPSSIEAVDDDEIPDDTVVLANFRVTYSTNEVSDYVKVNQEGEEHILELAEPLLTPATAPSETGNLVEELAHALSEIELDNITSHFTSAVAEYSNIVLTDATFSDPIDLEKAAELLDEIDDNGELRLGQIHQASTEELPQWMELHEEAERDPELNTQDKETEDHRS